MASTVFYGSVINPITLTRYDALQRCLLAVGPSGQVDWLVQDVDASLIQDTMAAHGCVDSEVFSLLEGQFIMPGFIDTHTVNILPLSVVPSHVF
jgi:guanine deaminase